MHISSASEYASFTGLSSLPLQQDADSDTVEVLLRHTCDTGDLFEAAPPVRRVRSCLRRMAGMPHPGCSSAVASASAALLNTPPSAARRIDQLAMVHCVLTFVCILSASGAHPAARATGQLPVPAAGRGAGAAAPGRRHRLPARLLPGPLCFLFVHCCMHETAHSHCLPAARPDAQPVRRAAELQLHAPLLQECEHHARPSLILTQ